MFPAPTPVWSSESRMGSANLYVQQTPPGAPGSPDFGEGCICRQEDKQCWIYTPPFREQGKMGSVPTGESLVIKVPLGRSHQSGTVPCPAWQCQPSFCIYSGRCGRGDACSLVLMSMRSGRALRNLNQVSTSSSDFDYGFRKTCPGKDS